MFDIIIAHNLSYGLGKNGKIPWNCEGDLKLFKQLTQDSILIMGRKTVENLPFLPNRQIFCLSKKGELKTDNNNSTIFSDLKTALEFAEKKFPNKKVFISGGEEIYRESLTNYLDMVNQIHVSVIDNDIECDVWFYIYSYFPSSIIYETPKKYEEFTYRVYRMENKGEKNYLALLSEILEHGAERKGRNGLTKSLFCKNLSFDLRKGFPLLTTKKMFFRGIVEELLFFIRGETNSKLLEEKGVNIWKANTERSFLDSNGKITREEGIMGPLYGYQWRFFNAKYCEKTGRPLEKGIDQLKNVINLIKTEPTSRRILMTDFNPSQAEEGVLYPCHSVIIQFYVSGDYLDMYCYNRSQDVFLGTPFNISSSCLFLTLIAKISNLIPRFLYMGLGDVHIYSQHYDHVKEQIKRIPFAFPKLYIDKNIETLGDIEKLQFSDFRIENYISHSAIRAEMIA